MDFVCGHCCDRIFAPCFLILLTEGLGYAYRCIFSSRRELRKMEFAAFREGLRMPEE